MTEAILLVGGLGTRLRPLTVHVPKPVLPVGGVPFLAHQIAKAHEVGVDHIVLACGFRPDVMREVLGDGSAWGVSITYVAEDEPLGTGGAIRNAANALRSASGDPVVVLNGDVLSGHNLAGQLKAHTERGADVTLHLVQVDDARAFGCVPTDDTGRVTAFLEKMPEPVSNQINAGCYIFQREVIDGIAEGRPVSVERETFPGLLADGRLLMGYVDNAYWIDIGTPAAYVRASADFVLGRVDTPARLGEPGEILVLDGADIADDAVVGGGTTVGRGVRVQSSATVEGSVLLNDAVVGTGAVVRASVIGVAARIGAGSMLDGVVIGDRAVVGEHNELRAGARVWCDSVIGDRVIRFSSDC